LHAGHFVNSLFLIFEEEDENEDEKDDEDGDEKEDEDWDCE
jgi:hypothetical protein